MNKTRRLATFKIGFVLFTALLGALTGCTTYVEQPRPREVYVPPPVAYVPPPAVEVEASVGFGIRAESDFYEPLTPYGRWEVVGSYGRCWIPARVEANWRPYSNGNWQRTDAGWYWASDEPWAWATYHYGRWDFSPQFGWYWVPQTQWAPAWVSWHEGGGYVGWAPLHPSARISVSGSVDVNVALIAPRAFVFVEQRRFLEPVRPTTVVVNNTTIINKTVNITKIKVVNKTVINEGPRTEVVEQASGRKVQAVPVRELRRKEEAAVVAKRRTPTPTSEKKVQTPVRSEAQPREQNAAPVRVQRQVEKPAVTANEPQARAPKKPVPSVAEAKPVANLPTAIKGPTEQKTEQQSQKQADKQDKRAEEVKKGAQRQSELRAKREQAASEEARKKAAKKTARRKSKNRRHPRKPRLFHRNRRLTEQALIWGWLSPLQ